MRIDPAFVTRILVGFIREELHRFGFRNGILGLSGGLDSSVCAALAAQALGPRHVIGLLMPYGKRFPAEVEDAAGLARRLGIRVRTIDIAPQIEAYFAAQPTSKRLLRGNKMARERMSILYDYSVREKALVLGTSNKTELLVGYGTLHGDLASAVNPLGDLYKTQVRALAAHLDIPDRIIAKTPTAGLWPGQTDEEELGMSYDELDRILYALVDERRSRDEAVASGLPAAAVDRVGAMIRRSEFKRKLPPIAKLSMRTVGHDFLYPYDWGT
jgi:NAD+ synthase